MNKPKKLGKNHKPKELRVEEKRQRTFVKEVLWPFLVKNTKHINEAKNVLEASVVGIQEVFDQAMLVEQTRLSKLNMKEYDVSKSVLNREDYKIEHEIIGLFGDESLATTKGLLQGMQRVIESFIREEMQGRTLDTLKTEFLD